MLRKHAKLWADLAFRTDPASGGKVDAEWRKAFEEFPDRFIRITSYNVCYTKLLRRRPRPAWPSG